MTQFIPIIKQVTLCGKQGKMQTVSMHDLKQLSYWQGKRFKSGHWYTLNPAFSGVNRTLRVVEITRL